MTQRSSRNNTNVALGPYGLFTGAWEPTNVFLEIAAYVNSSAYLAVSIQQSVDASNVNINTTFNYTPTTEVSVFNTAVGLPYYRVKLENEANVQVAFMSLNTLLVAAPNTPVAIDGIITGNVAITSPLDANGDVEVKATNLITETLAKRRVDFLVSGDWYRVANPGLTSGAEWQVISGGTACVGGQSVPDVGRLFKCVVAGPAVAGGGECFDVEYTTDVSATITNFPSFPATQPVSIAQDLSCNILNFPATQAVSGTVSLTNPTTVRVSDYYGDPILTTSGNVMVGISNIYTANPLHTILDSGSVAVSSLPAITGSVSATITTNPVIVKEKPSYTVNLNAVSITSQTIRSSAGCLSGLCLSHVGGSQFCFFKIYNSSSATSADTPLATFSLYKDTTLMIDTHAMNFSAGLCVRGTDDYAVSDNTPPPGSLKVVAFVTGYSE